MDTIRVTASEFEQALGELTEKAAREPVTIRGKAAIIWSSFLPKNTPA
jgi:hypothetical protein